MINKFIANGRITKKPELKCMSNTNTSVLSFTLAVTRNYKNQNGEYDSDFINCVAFNNTAELINSYVNKGDLIGIEGMIQTRKYKDEKADKTIYVTEVIVEKIDFLQQKKEETNTSYKTIQREEITIKDDELPF